MPQVPKKRISTFVEQQLPSFVREADPTFISFLEAYYEWAEESGNVVETTFGLLDLNDIDTTVDRFFDYFQNEFIPNIPNSVLTNKRTLIKHIKDFYRAKGTEKSYKFLFRILYNENVDFYYPKLDLIKPSDGKWHVDRVIRTTTGNDTFNFISRRIQGVSSGATANIENVIQFGLGADIISECYLSSISGAFIVGEKINVYLANNTVQQELIYGLVNQIVVDTPGVGYQVNDEVTVTGADGANTTAAVEEVGGTDSGRVVAATHLYIPDFAHPETVIPANITLEDKTAVLQAVLDPDTGGVARVNIVKRGRDYASVPTITFSSGSAAATAILDSSGRIS